MLTYTLTVTKHQTYQSSTVGVAITPLIILYLQSLYIPPHTTVDRILGVPIMYGSFLWFQNPCGCATCLKLRESFASAYQAVQNAHQAAPSYKSVVAAASAIGEAAEKVHREHCPELYIGLADLSLANSNGVEVRQQSDSEAV